MTRKKIIRKIVEWTLAAAVLLFAWSYVRVYLRPAVPPPSQELRAQARRVKILRDQWGIPHIYGKRDADTAFGLAYAHAEDDFPTLMNLTAASRGRLAWLHLSQLAAVNDFLVAFLDVPGQVEEQYPQIPADVRAVLEGYAAGLNYYASQHPNEVDARLLPFRGEDIAAGFVHKIPLLVGIDRPLSLLNAAESVEVGDVLQRDRRASDFVSGLDRGDRMLANTILPDFRSIGSNSHAVAPARSTDGVTRLNINSHQPWQGPVAWYEAHLVSEEGWNMTGGTFPGGPMIFHGHNETLGWAHTVNMLDLVDVYKLEVDEDGRRYKLDGEWRELEVREARLEIDLGVFTLPVTREVYRSVHGPVLKTDHGFYAIRFAGIGRHIRVPEQWFRMNKARNYREWRAAMELQYLPMFNATYADRAGNVYYVFNALMPERAPGYDYRAVLPGDTSKNIWQSYRPYSELPQVENPPSGFVHNCNNDPFMTTVGPGNPRRKDYTERDGIRPWVNNRGLQSLALFGGDEKISREEFIEYKFDRAYHPDSPMMKDVVGPLLATYEPQNDAEARALDLLRDWDRHADENSSGATIAVLAFSPLWYARITDRTELEPPVAETFRDAVAFLLKHYGRVDVPLGQVQYLKRGDTLLQIGGGVDVMNATISKVEDGRLIGWAGDSYIAVVEFTKDGVSSRALNVYGASNRPGSPHYDDQAPLFVKRTLRKNLYTEAEIREYLFAEYHPGEE